MARSVDTARVADRRKLRFETIDDLLAEVDRIAAADREGRLETLGNWTPGQILSHEANWIDYGWKGYPLKRSPWLIRMILKCFKKRYLTRGMPAGVKIPGSSTGTYGANKVSTAEGAEHLRRSLARLASGEAAIHPSPAFGPMSESERVRLNLRHAELHLGFLKYE